MTIESMRNGRRRFATPLLAGAVLAVAAGVGGMSAHAQDHGGSRFGGPPGGGMMMGDGRPEQALRRLDGMLDGLGVSDAQRSQIRQIAMAAAGDLRTQRDAGRALHNRGMQIFTAPNVDPAAAEALRQQMLAQHDQASKRVVQAMLDIARVLTPEQRARIGARMQEREAMMKDRMQRMQREHGGPMSRDALPKDAPPRP